MVALLLSVTLFGLVHPGSKWILDSGLDLQSFCIGYILVRFLIQIPIVVMGRAYKIQSWRELFLLISLGMAGACLQLAEFKGVKDQIPVPIVSFLICCHPVWTVFLNRYINGSPITASAILKTSLAILGVFLIVGSGKGAVTSTKLLVPLSASLFLGLWICISTLCRKNVMRSSTISFYYDAFSLLILLGLNFVRIPATILPFHWFMADLNGPKLVLYSIFIGYVPNVLFYWGCSKVGALSAGLLLLMEPVISSIISSSIWKIELPPLFSWGAILILMGNTPFHLLVQRFEFLKVWHLKP